MKKILLFTVALCLFASTAFAAEAKFGFFNMGEVAISCDAYKAEQKKIKDSFASEEKALEKQGKDLQKKFDDFKNKASGLSPEAREEKNLELMRLSRDFDDKRGALGRKIAAASNRAQEELSRLILIAVVEYGKKNGFTAIIDSNNSGAFWVDKSVDVTRQILEESNKVWKQKPKALTDKKQKLDAGASLNR